MKRIAYLLFSFISCLAVWAATPPSAPSLVGIVRFVSPGGSATNDGSTVSTPWSLDYGLSQANSSIRLTLMPGLYPSIAISRPGTRLTSSAKRGVRIAPTPGRAGIWTESNVTDVVIERIEVAGGGNDGISLNGSGCMVRDCWIHDCLGNGITAQLNSNTVIERNLVERNGGAPPGRQGISLSGTNCIIRGNVIRYNSDWGCSIYANAPYSSANCAIYENLIYNNGAGVTVWSPSGQTNFIINNTIISPSNNCLIADFGNLQVTNNIMIVGGANPVVYAADGAQIWSDYNMVNVTTASGGAHEVVTSSPGFVNSSAGLYWLAADSPAIRKANSSIIPPVDFFGRRQTSVSDIGALQYNSALAADVRILDPSTTNGADYWVQLNIVTDSPPIIVSQPKAQAIVAGQNASFTVIATGSAPLTYHWTFNGAVVTAISNTYVRANCQLADSGGQVQVTVSDESGSAQSTTATLTVRLAGKNYYVAPNGSSSNDGLTPNSAWPLQYALDNAGTSNTVIVADGVYTPVGQPFYLRDNAAGLTVVAQNKWKAVIKDSPSYGIQIYSCRYVTVDGLCISNSYYNGMKISCDHITIRNCWVTCNGNGCTGEGDGIASNGSYAGYTPSNNIFEYNLIERNGCFASRRGHAIYFNGVNNVVRGNVCRNNGYFGIHLFGSYSSPGTPEHNDANLIYNNLVYGHTNGYGVALWNAAQDNNAPTVPQNPGTNFCFGNTILDGIQVAWGGAFITNNIIRSFVSAAYGLPIDSYTNAYSPAVLAEDYNLTDHNPITQPSLKAGGTHDVISSNSSSWFVNPSKGLFWLGGSSPARSAASSAICGPVNFFGTPQDVVSDIGAFQYNATLASDVRVLDSSASSPDYWSLP